MGREAEKLGCVVKAVIIVLMFMFFLLPRITSSQVVSGAEHEPHFGIHSDGLDLINDFDSMADFAETSSAVGYSIILVNLIPAGVHYFVSPALAVAIERARVHPSKDGRLEKRCREITIIAAQNVKRRLDLFCDGLLVLA
ncbi:MAG: hypothetical protein ACE5NG_11195 [bacterium]